MADSLPSPPHSRESTPHNDVHGTEEDDVTRRLDELLEQYLEVLDEYTVLREQLSKSFSDGFMSLAHAQRTSNLGPGRRYGRDGYDGRMKALRRIKIERRGKYDQSNDSSINKHSKSEGVLPSDAEEGYCFNITPFPQRVQLETYTNEGNGESLSKPGADSRDLAVNQEHKEEDKSVQEEKQAVGAPKKSKIDPAYRDPVTWYGILVPPALRQSQKNFISSAEGVIPQLATVACLLRSIESKIWLMREEISVKKAVLASEIHDISHRPAKLTLR